MALIKKHIGFDDNSIYIICPLGKVADYFEREYESNIIDPKDVANYYTLYYFMKKQLNDVFYAIRVYKMDDINSDDILFTIKMPDQFNTIAEFKKARREGKFDDTNFNGMIDFRTNKKITDIE